MISEYTPVKTPLIQDVALPTVGDAMRKNRKQKKKTIPVRYLNRYQSFTRVPPMAVMHEPRQPLFKSSVAGNGPKIAAFILFLPKKYVSDKGVVTDWHAPAFSELKYIAPILLGCYGLMLLALSWQPIALPSYKAGHYVKHTAQITTQPQQSSVPVSAPAASSYKPSSSTYVAPSSAKTASTAQPAASPSPINSAPVDTSTVNAPVPTPTPVDAQDHGSVSVDTPIIDISIGGTTPPDQAPTP